MKSEDSQLKFIVYFAEINQNLKINRSAPAQLVCLQDTSSSKFDDELPPPKKKNLFLRWVKT